MWQASVILHQILRLLLLFSPAQPQTTQSSLAIIRQYSSALDEDFEDFEAEFFRTGATLEPTKDKFKQKTLIPLDAPMLTVDEVDCNRQILFRNVHDKLHCVNEHYLLQAEYEEIRNICHYSFIKCKNGVRKCNRGTRVMKGLYCRLKSGTLMPECVYETFIRRGLPLITCKWQNAEGKLVPVGINDISMPVSD